MRETFKQIAGTMCDFHDFYQRMAEQLPSGARIVEVGVADGHSAIFLAERLADLGKEFHMHLVENMAYGGLAQATTIMHNIIRSGLGDKMTLHLMSSLDASCQWPDNWAHFVFLDSSHRYEQTKAEIRLWYRKVMFGHVLAGHDYNELAGYEVKQAVDEVLCPPLHFDYDPHTEKKLGVWYIKKTDAGYVN